MSHNEKETEEYKGHSLFYPIDTDIKKKKLIIFVKLLCDFLMEEKFIKKSIDFNILN